jgi:hypothetical protein
MATEPSKIPNDFPETENKTEPVTGKFDGRKDKKDTTLNR